MLLTWIREVADEPLLLNPAARYVEARENTWSLSASVDERRSLLTADVVAAWEECASTLRQRVRSLGYTGAATFYVWHDVQAGQLRCSMASLPEDQVPFRAPIRLGVPLEVIVSEFLADTTPGVVAVADLVAGTGSAKDESRPDDFALPVWTVDVGSRA